MLELILKMIFKFLVFQSIINPFEVNDKRFSGKSFSLFGKSTSDKIFNYIIIKHIQ